MTVHTFEYTRATSPPLTTAVLAAASTFTRRDLHPQLLNHIQTILNRAMSNGACDIGIVQSIIISVYWKAPTDRTAWMKIGWAVRMGYQMRWHHPWRTQLPADERELRMALVSAWANVYEADLSRIRRERGSVRGAWRWWRPLTAVLHATGLWCEPNSCLLNTGTVELMSCRSRSKVRSPPERR
jgi:hypothetical protein